MKCESCDRDFPSVYYFKAKGLCNECYDKLSEIEKEETEPLYEPIPKPPKPKPRLAGFLKGTTTFVLLVLTLGGLGITMAFVALMIDPDLYHFDSFKDFGILYEITAEQEAEPWLILETSSELRNIKLTTAVAMEFTFTNRATIILYFVIKYLVLGFTFTIFYKLRKIFITLENREPFNTQNAKRIRWIGYSIIGISLTSIIVGGILLVFLNEPFRISGMQIQTYCLAVYMNLADNISSIFWGGLVLLIAEIFRQAVKLKEEQDLTV